MFNINCKIINVRIYVQYFIFKYFNYLKNNTLFN